MASGDRIGMTAETELLVAGGGLAAGLLALAIRQRRPGVRVTLVEQGERLGGNHLWSFFESDVAPQDMPLVAPLVVRRWAGYDVAFPGHARTIGMPYHTIASERLDAALRTALPPAQIVTGVAVRALDRGTAFLADGRAIRADAIVDARGFRDGASLELGWQKFVGQLLRFEQPHGLDRPMIMDATVDQAEGYRFVYLLPFDRDRLFVEDTYYSTDPAIDRDVVAARIADYVRARGWAIAAIEREEQAALPIAMAGDFEGLWRAGAQGIGKIGMAAGLFQPMTGYSLPDAVRTAALVAGLPTLTTATVHDALRAHAEKAWRARGYYRLLARLLFRAAAPAQRYRMLERFYRLDARRIARFYAARSTRTDKLRILCGRPPVPILAAARVIGTGR